MIYHDTQQWQICPLIAHYRADGVPISKYTNDRRWWERFAAKWGRLDSISFTPVPAYGWRPVLELVQP